MAAISECRRELVRATGNHHLESLLAGPRPQVDASATKSGAVPRGRGVAFLVVLALILFGEAPGHAGTLYGVTGDGAETAESLFILSQTDGTPTFLTALGHGNHGEAIAFNPDDGLIYHWSGSRTGERVFESVAPNTLDVSVITVRSDPSDATYSEVLGATFNPSTGEFLVVDLIQALRSFSTSGEVTNVGVLDHLSKGLAFVDGKLYSIEQTFGGSVPRLLEIDPTNASTLSQLEISLPSPDHEVNRGNGLASNPDTGQLWALLTVRDSSGSVSRSRLLASLDLQTGEASAIGFTGDAFSGIAFVSDTDGDGVPDHQDDCPDSDVTANVVINGCDSGVGNTLFDDGCKISDLIDECAAGATNHGEFVSCVAHLVIDLSKAGAISAQDAASIIVCAAQSSVP